LAKLTAVVASRKCVPIGLQRVLDAEKQVELTALDPKQVAITIASVFRPPRVAKSMVGCHSIAAPIPSKSAPVAVPSRASAVTEDPPRCELDVAAIDDTRGSQGIEVGVRRVDATDPRRLCADRYRRRHSRPTARREQHGGSSVCTLNLRNARAVNSTAGSCRLATGLRASQTDRWVARFP